MFYHLTLTIIIQMTKQPLAHNCNLLFKPKGPRCLQAQLLPLSSLSARGRHQQVTNLPSACLHAYQPLDSQGFTVRLRWWRRAVQLVRNSIKMLQPVEQQKLLSWHDTVRVALAIVLAGELCFCFKLMALV